MITKFLGWVVVTTKQKHLHCYGPFDSVEDGNAWMKDNGIDHGCCVPLDQPLDEVTNENARK